MGDTIFSSKEGEGRMGGDVVSYVEYTIGALYEDAEKNSSYLLQAFGHPSQLDRHTEVAGSWPLYATTCPQLDRHTQVVSSWPLCSSKCPQLDRHTQVVSTVIRS
jgi:hypothetical protein